MSSNRLIRRWYATAPTSIRDTRLVASNATTILARSDMAGRCARPRARSSERRHTLVTAELGVVAAEADAVRQLELPPAAAADQHRQADHDQHDGQKGATLPQAHQLVPPVAVGRMVND